MSFRYRNSLIISHLISLLFSLSHLVSVRVIISFLMLSFSYYELSLFAIVSVTVIVIVNLELLSNNNPVLTNDNRTVYRYANV